MGASDSGSRPRQRSDRGFAGRVEGDLPPIRRFTRRRAEKQVRGNVDSRIARVFLSGGTARIPALFKVIEARAGVPVEILNPFKNIEVDNRRFDPAVILAAAPSVAVGVGLALRRPGDK